MAPTPFPEIGRRAKDLLGKDYNFNQKFVLSVPSPAGMNLTATGLNRGQVFSGDLNTQYRSGNTMVLVKVDTYSNITTIISVDEALPGTRMALSFNIPDHKSGKLDLHYLHPLAAVNSSIGLNPSPLLDFNAAIGAKGLSLGGEVAFDTASASFTKYNVGISFNQRNFSAALILKDNGHKLEASYYHNVDPVTKTKKVGCAVAAEMTHRFSNNENSFAFGSAHAVTPYTALKTRFKDSGKVAIQCQHAWRHKSSLIVSAEYDTKRIKSPLKLGVSLTLKP